MVPKEILDSIETFSREKISPTIKIISTESLSGGCINHVQRIRTNEGDFCLKYNLKASFPGLFECESAGLLLLKENSPIKVPSVVFSGTAGEYIFILLEFINSAKRIPDFMEDFGRSLAKMHLNSEDYFGLDHDNYIGSLRQSNTQHEDWISFFIQERLEKQVHLARTTGNLDHEHTNYFRKLYSKLESLIPQEPPALLHGDLWSGNFMVSEEGKPCLIDPAVYYGNREADLAMTALFGGFDNTFYESYNESYPLQADWKNRLPLYQLYPLLIHLNLFGRSYRESINEILKRF